MKILFIGGNGNISWYCVQKAIEAGHEVYELNRGMTSKTRRDIQPQVQKLTGDFRNRDETRRLLDPFFFDVVVDFICFNKEQAEFDVELFRRKTRHFVHISTTAVYERKTKYMPYKENTPQWKSTDYNYAYDKIEAETVFKKAYEKMEFPTTIVRPSYTYDTIIPVSIGHNCFTAPQRYLNGKPVLIAGDGTNLFTFTHSRDFAAALTGLLENHDAVGEDFHITSDEWLTWLDITEVLIKLLGVESPLYIHIPVEEILRLQIPVSSQLSVSYLGKGFASHRMWCDIYDNSKIKKFVPGWQAATKYESGLRETIEWMFEKDERRRINPVLDAVMEELTMKYGCLSDHVREREIRKDDGRP
jgi:nucleoside-diphosphate-sugar epimerase